MLRRKTFAVLSFLCLAFRSLSADEGDLSNDDIVKEIQSGKKAHVIPDRFLFNVKPFSFIFAQSVAKDLPYPINCLQAEARLIGRFAIQAEPIFVKGADGGMGFSVGPTYFPDYPWDEVHVIPKYEFVYINGMGAYHGGMLEIVRRRLFGNLLVNYGGAVGYGINGATGTTDDFTGESRILSVDQGFTYEINLGLGFAL